MSFDPLSAAFDLGKVAIEKIWPDETKRAEEIRKLEELRQNGELAVLTAEVQLLVAQIEVNKEEAKHANIFISGWRPAIGWVGVFGMSYQFLLYPVLVWGWALLQAGGFISIELGHPPIIDTEALMVLLTGILGIGSLRSIDKYHGVDTK